MEVYEEAMEGQDHDSLDLGRSNTTRDYLVTSTGDVVRLTARLIAIEGTPIGVEGTRVPTTVPSHWNSPRM